MFVHISRQKQKEYQDNYGGFYDLRGKVFRGGYSGSFQAAGQRTLGSFVMRFLPPV